MEAPEKPFVIHDPLTGLYDGRYLEEKLLVEFSRAVRYRHPLSCLILDPDLFRALNEARGLLAGDAVLKETANLLREECRSSDLVGRLDGGKFAVLLPHIDYEEAFQLAERLRERLARHPFSLGNEKVFLTFSIGISSFPGDVIHDRKDLLSFAAQALARAKTAGRNRIARYRDAGPFLGDASLEFKVNEAKMLELQRKLSGIAREARRLSIESTKMLMQTLEAEDALTAGHAQMVAHLARQTAQTLGLPLAEAETIEQAALLHDIGRLCLSEEITRKAGEFTLAEYEAMKQHPYLGYRILKPIPELREEAILILHHHEWFNGEGYPSRLVRNEIPLGSRIIGTVDAYDTMRSAEVRYQRTRSVEEAVDELIRCAGTQFDPEVIQAFIQVLLIRKELTAEAYDKDLLKRTLESSK
jgi:diguanylate cyclase (GGDEF)-like protein